MQFAKKKNEKIAGVKLYKWRTEIAKAEITIALLFIYYIFVEIMNLNCLVDGLKLSSYTSFQPARHFSALIVNLSIKANDAWNIDKTMSCVLGMQYAHCIAQ